MGSLDDAAASWPRRLRRAVFLAALCSVGSFDVLAADEEERLARRIKAEILRELRDDKFLAEQIELGIARYVEKAKAAQDAAQARQADEKARTVRRPTPSRDHIRGPVDAEISLIEFSDFECPYCKTFHRNAAELLKTVDGKVNWVYRHYPLAFHPGAQKQAEATECARELGGEGAFWAYADALFARTTSGGKGFSDSKLVPLAKELGLNVRAFQRCLASGRHETRIKEDFDEGQRIGITGTPTTVIFNNRTGQAHRVVGVLSVSELQEKVALLLAKPQASKQAR